MSTREATTADDPVIESFDQLVAPMIGRQGNGRARQKAMAICAGSFSPTPTITMKSGRICPCSKILRSNGPCSGAAKSARSRFSADFIINIAGCSIQ